MSGCHAARLRCPVCGNPDWHRRGGPEECTHCGLVVADATALRTAASAIPARLAAGRATGEAGDAWQMSDAAWRNAAFRSGYVLDGEYATRAVPRRNPAALGIITRPCEWPGVATLLRRLTPWFDRSIVMVDAPDATELPSVPIGVEVHCHPMAGDFAAQRNRVQAVAGRGWVLQLDSDERPTLALLRSLGWLIAAAERDGLASLGLPRLNVVDGRRSALWPDIQYRLNRAEVRFEGRVHERPAVPFEATSLALGGAILHRMSGARVRARTALYGAMAAEGARACDEARLLRVFDATAER